MFLKNNTFLIIGIIAIVLNIIFVGYFFGFFATLSSVFFAVCVFLGWYIRALLGDLRETKEDLLQIREIATEFVTHLEEVYNLETYYGDDTLENLLKHGRFLVNQFEEVYSLYLFDDQEIDEYGEEEEEE